MRVLFAAKGDKTIFQYLVPLAWALRTAGHEVRFASQPSFADTITGAGLTAVPVGRDRDMWRLAYLNRAQLEVERATIPKPYDVAAFPEKATWEYLTEGMDEALYYWHKMENFGLISELVAYARHWRPDLVIWEPASFAGAIAARACGAAHARLLFGVDVFGLTRGHVLRLNAARPPDRRTDAMADWLGSYARRYGFGFTEDLVTGHFTIDQFPRSLQPEADLHYVRMRYVPYGGRAVVPRWLWEPPARPRVAFTMGLSATDRYQGYTVDVQDILDSVADLDIEFVATIADRVREQLARIPDNARLVPYVPLQALLPTCAAVIHHAGVGTLATTALHGVPHLAVPWDVDQPALAARMVAAGAGLAVPAPKVTGPTIRDNLTRLLTEPAFRAGAGRLRAEMLAQPGPNAFVPRLVELVRRHRGAG
jgi:glycosyltransferase (activator-dependent family)